jgi:hypothetical protein
MDFKNPGTTRLCRQGKVFDRPNPFSSAFMASLTVDMPGIAGMDKLDRMVSNSSVAPGCNYEIAAAVNSRFGNSAN